MRIAYCDEDRDDKDKMINVMGYIEEKWKSEFEFQTFSNEKELCESMRKVHYEILILDIDVDGVDGIEIATRIHLMGEEPLMIFVSKNDERVKELFDFRPIAFLNKPIEVEELEKTLEKAYQIMGKAVETVFSYKKNGIVKYVPIKDIICFESLRNNIKICTTKYEESFCDTLSNTWGRLQKTDCFIMPSKSFIFNLNYVTIKKNSIMVKGKREEYSMGKKYKEDTEERYLRYIEKKYKCI